MHTCARAHTHKGLEGRSIERTLMPEGRLSIYLGIIISGIMRVHDSRTYVCARAEVQGGVPD